MKKYAYAFLVILVISVVVTREHQKYSPDSQSQQQGITNLPSVTPSNPPNTQGNSAKAEGNSPSWDMAYLVFGWPNGITVWALFLTLIVIAEQTSETRKAAQATEAGAKATLRQAEVQAAGMRQWLEILPRGVEERSKGQINVLFQIVNSTAYPLTIRSITTKVSIRANTLEISKVDPNTTLPPGGGNEDSGMYGFYAVIPMEPDEMKEFRYDWQVLTINGTVIFVDCLNRVETQHFGGLYEASGRELKLLNPLGEVPKTSTEKQASPEKQRQKRN